MEEEPREIMESVKRCLEHSSVYSLAAERYPTNDTEYS